VSKSKGVIRHLLDYLQLQGKGKKEKGTNFNTIPYPPSPRSYANFYKYSLIFRNFCRFMDFISTEIRPYLNFIHPPLMWILLGSSIYAMYLGLKIRKTRTATGEEKKQLIQGKYNNRHYQIGSIILAVMVLGTIGGMAATYINNGKLFVGPHLLVGLGMTGLIAVSAAMSPYMQKGQDWARYTHIVLNSILVGLFGWQAFSGMEILQRIVSKM
jgi:hypothetical protein